MANRIKDNPAKKPITKTKANKNKGLSPLESKLLNFAEQGLPVLLFGKDAYGREDLIKKIHLLNGGIDASWEYVGNEKNIDSFDALENEIRKAEENLDIDRVGELARDCRDTVRTHRRINCGGFQSSAKVLNILFAREDNWTNNYIFQEGLSLQGNPEVLNNPNRVPEDNTLIQRNGLLFLDNLECENKDDKWYKRLTHIVEKRRFRDSDSGNWLVVYTHNPNTFPLSFRDQFELVSLDGKEAVVVPVDEVEPVEEQARDYEFFLSGDTWKISYEGKAIFLQNSIGLQYIHFLLRNPGNEIYVLDLVQEMKQSLLSKGIYNKTDKGEQEGQLTDEGVHKGLTKNTGDVLDKEGIQLLKDTYEDLESELNDDELPPSEERTAEIEKEMKDIKKALIAGRDKFGKPRKFPAEAEKARKAVSKAYNESLKKIENDEQENPTPWKHFKNTLTIGIYCSYKPETPIPWEL